MRFATVLIVLVLVVIHDESHDSRADDAAATAKSQELKKLQGTWIVVSAKQYKIDLIDLAKDTKVVIEGNKLKISEGPQKHLPAFGLVVDPTKAPKEMDIIGGSGTLEAIYILEEDRFTIHLSNSKRPASFSGETKGSDAIWVFKRQ